MITCSIGIMDETHDRTEYNKEKKSVVMIKDIITWKLMSF